MNTSAKSKTSFIMPNNNVTITPNWTADERYRVILKCNWEDFPLSGAGYYRPGETVNINVDNSGWPYIEFISWAANMPGQLPGPLAGNNKWTNMKTSFIMPKNPVYLEATFVI